MNPLDHLGEQRRDRQHLDVGVLLDASNRQGISGDKFADRAGCQPLECLASHNRMHHTRRHRCGTARDQQLGRSNQRIAGGYFVVHEDAVSPFDVADDIQRLDMAHVLVRWVDVIKVPLFDNRQRHPQLLGKIAGPLCKAHVGGDDGIVVDVLFAEVAYQQRHRTQLIDRDRKEALDLPRMEVKGDDLLCTSRLNHIGHQTGSNGHTWLIALVGPPICIKRQHRSHPPCRRTPTRIEDNQQLHDAITQRRSQRLHNEDVFFAHTLVQPCKQIIVRVLGQRDVTEGHTEPICNGLRNGGIATATENPHLAKTAAHVSLVEIVFCSCIVISFITLGNVEKSGPLRELKFLRFHRHCR